VAEGLATAVVEWLFPPRRTRAALLDPRTAPSTADRYRTVGTVLGVDVRPAIDTADVEATNAALADVLANRLATELWAKYDDPAAAADDSTVETTTVTIRRWQP